MNISDHLVQLLSEDEFDKTPLMRDACLVNMRLYKINASYRRIILEIIRYMDEHLHSHFDDYPDPFGVSAPNLGFPMRIIGFKKRTNESQFCLNPEITKSSTEKTITSTNCGSLKLKEKVRVERFNTIDFKYFDLEGNAVQKHFVNRGEGGFTIQHEIDQINGKTIISGK